MALPTRKLKHSVMAVAEKKLYEPGDGVYIGLENIRSWTGEIDTQATTFPDGTVSLFNVGDILFGKLRPYLAKVALAPFSGAASTEALVLRARDHMWPPYLRYVLGEKGFIERVSASTFGAQMPRASWDFIGSQVIPTPDLAAQKAIADSLDRETARIDHLIAKKQQIVRLLGEKRSSLIAGAVTRGVDPGVQMKPSGIEWLGDVPAHWNVTRLKWIGEAITGLTYSPDHIVDAEGGTLVLRSSNIQNSRIDLTSTVYVSAPIPERLRTRCGDILICSRNGSRDLIGKNALIGKDLENATFGAFMTVFRTRHSQFIYHVLNSPIFTFQAGAYLTSTINQLTLFTLNSLEIPLPPPEEELSISRYIEAKSATIDSASRAVVVSISRLRELRSALITAAVTGQIDVTTWGRQGETDRRLDAIQHELEAERAEVPG